MPSLDNVDKALAAATSKPVPRPVVYRTSSADQAYPRRKTSSVRNLARHMSQEAAMTAATAALIRLDQAQSTRAPEDPNVFGDEDTALLELVVNNGHVVMDIAVLEHASKWCPVSLSFIMLDNMPVARIFSTSTGELTIKSFLHKPGKRNKRVSGGLLPLPVFLKLKPDVVDEPEPPAQLPPEAAPTPTPLSPVYARPQTIPVRRRTVETAESSDSKLKAKVQVPDDPNVFHTADLTLTKLMDRNGHLVADLCVLETDNILAPMSSSFLAVSGDFEKMVGVDLVHIA